MRPTGVTRSQPGTTRRCSTRRSLNYAAPFGKLIVAAGRPIDDLLTAFRTGGGVPYEDYGVDLAEGQAAFTRPMFETSWVASGCRRSLPCTSGFSPSRPPG